jgi:prepilin-type N-terminal cleavage/methylation domain-containing protein
MYQRLLTARQARRNEDGFTLIELLIVIVILGVLAGIVVFSVRGISDRGDAAACKANRSAADTAVEAYYAKNGSNPANLAAVVPDFLKTDPSAASVDAKIRVSYASGTVTGGSSC